MQKNNMSFLKNLTTVADARTARASSWDQSGRNKDYWLVNAGDTAVMADIERTRLYQSYLGDNLLQRNPWSVYPASDSERFCCTGNRDGKCRRC